MKSKTRSFQISVQAIKSAPTSIGKMIKGKYKDVNELGAGFMGGCFTISGLVMGNFFFKTIPVIHPDLWDDNLTAQDKWDGIGKDLLAQPGIEQTQELFINCSAIIT